MQRPETRPGRISFPVPDRGLFEQRVEQANYRALQLPSLDTTHHHRVFRLVSSSLSETAFFSLHLYELPIASLTIPRRPPAQLRHYVRLQLRPTGLIGRSIWLVVWHLRLVWQRWWKYLRWRKHRLFVRCTEHKQRRRIQIIVRLNHRQQIWRKSVWPAISRCSWFRCKSDVQLWEERRSGR